MEEQLKNQFDKATLLKIAKGALIAGTGTIALYLLDWATTLDLGTFTPLLAAIVPIIVNGIKEFMKGE